MKKLTFLLLTLATTLTLSAQVAINTTGAAPNNSAMLDVQSTTTGMLVPRMSTTQRTAISSTANGLLVYDLTTQSFWFYQNSLWTELRAGNITALSDADGDTKVVVDDGTDGDTIKFYSNGINDFSMDSMRLIPNGNSVFIGRSSGGNILDRFNIAVGDSALYHNGEGVTNRSEAAIYNTAIGVNTLFFNTTGMGNTALGAFALDSNITGNDNTALGGIALFSNKSGEYNTALGLSALYLNTSGNYNTASGSEALYSNSTGNYNTASGYDALANNTTGYSNVAIGVAALFSDSTGSNLVAIGDSALYNNTMGFANTAIGSKTLFSNTAGFNNTASGFHALYSNISYENTAFGAYALFWDSTGSSNTASGYLALYSNKTGYYNTASGVDALSSNITGSNNTAIGGRALQSKISGNANVAIGISALYSDTTSSNLVAVGDSALYNNTDGSDNTATGSKTLFNNTSGNHNTVMGSRTMFANVSGTKNTALGYRTFYSHKSGNNNTVLGSDALSTNTSGAYNVAVGANAGTNLSSGSNNIIIGGNGLDFPSNTHSNQLNIGNIIYGTNIDGTVNDISTGNIGIGVQYPEERLHVDGNIRMDYNASVYWTTYIVYDNDYNFSYNGTLKAWIDDVDGSYHSISDRRLKASIKPIDNALPIITALQPVTYYMKCDSSRQEKIGMIAQEVEKYFPQAVQEKNGLKTLNYAVFGVLAIEAVKEQQKEIDDLEQRLIKLEKLMQNK